MTAGKLVTAMVLMTVVTQCSASPDDPPTDGVAWVKYRHTNASFSLEHPPNWRVERAEGSISTHLSHPKEPVHLFVAAFIMNEGALDEFAKSKFGVQSDFFGPVGPARKMQGPGWNGLLQEADHVGPDRKESTRRVVLCANHDNLYVSLSLYLDHQDLASRQKYYERLLTSLRFGE